MHPLDGGAIASWASLAADPQLNMMPVAAGLLVLRDQEIPLVAALPTE